MSIKVPIYSKEGQHVGEHTLDAHVFGVTPSEALLHQVVTSYRANQRRPWAHTKTRGEVRGGGKKPWRQKGTGRARHGSTRSPIWKGGGVAHGPRNDRNYEQKINAKMARKALMMALTDKVQTGRLVILQDVALEPLKTKTASTLLLHLPFNKEGSSKNRSWLFGLSKEERAVRRALRNIAHSEVSGVADLNAYHVLAHGVCVLSLNAVHELTQRLSSVAS